MGAVIGVTAGIALIAGGAILTMTGIGALIGIPMMAAGVGVLYGGLTNGRAFIDRPLKAILGYSLGGLDLGYSLVASVFDGQPAPWVEHTSDGALVHNSRGCSIITGHSGSCAWGYVGHIRTGASRQVEMHERGHMSDNGIGRGDFFGISGYSTDEFTADLRAGTLNYNESKMIVFFVLSRENPELDDAFMLWNMSITTGSGFIASWLSYRLRQG